MLLHVFANVNFKVGLVGDSKLRPSDSKPKPLCNHSVNIILSSSNYFLHLKMLWTFCLTTTTVWNFVSSIPAYIL